MIGGMAKMLFQSRFGAKITDAQSLLCRASFKLRDNLCQPLFPANRRSGNNTDAVPFHITNHGIASRRKPMRNARVQNLVRRGVPTVLQNQFAHTLKIGRNNTGDLW